MIALVLGALLSSFSVAIVATAVMRRMAPTLGLVDKPGARKVHTTPTPLGGGIGIWAGLVLPLVGLQLVLWLLAQAGSAAAGAGSWWSDFIPEIVWQHASGLRYQSPRLWIMLAAGTLLVGLGLWDDRKGLDWKVRIGVQTAIAVVMVAFGWQMTLFLNAPWLTGFLSVVWIVGLINSFNMLDNMDGLSAGVAAIAALIMACVMLLAPAADSRQPQLFVGGLLLVLLGSLLGFLWHNRPPAKIFMGDAGSYLVGFILATATISATFAVGDTPRQHSILAPLCVLAVPIYDTTSVVIIRLRQGKSPFEGDKNHFSHRLVDLGLTKPQAVLVIYLTTLTTSLGALLLYQVDGFGAAVVLTLVACVLCVIAILEATARKKVRGGGTS